MVVSQHTSVCYALQNVKLSSIYRVLYYKFSVFFFNSIAEAWDYAVVNISSVQAYNAMPYYSGWTYQASKAAVTTMSKCMALDLSVHGIRVNSICPGYIWTEHVMLYKLCLLFFC